MPAPPELPLTVFVVDDDASFRTAIARLLGASGYQVALYGSASELLEKLPGAPPGNSSAVGLRSAIVT